MADTTNKKINKKATIQNILDKANSSNAISINVEKFNKRKNDIDFVKECANFLGTEIVYR